MLPAHGSKLLQKRCRCVHRGREDRSGPGRKRHGSAPAMRCDSLLFPERVRARWQRGHRAEALWIVRPPQPMEACERKAGRA
jgi:hypothetical protein